MNVNEKVNYQEKRADIFVKKMCDKLGWNYISRAQDGLSYERDEDGKLVIKHLPRPTMASPTDALVSIENVLVRIEFKERQAKFKSFNSLYIETRKVAYNDILVCKFDNDDDTLYYIAFDKIVKCPIISKYMNKVTASSNPIKVMKDVYDVPLSDFYKINLNVDDTKKPNDIFHVKYI